jgi:RNA polymerase sigma factor (sigma-70 family)
MSPPPAEQFAARIFVGPALRAQPDRRLVDLVRDGYDAAFEEIVRRYRRPLDRFAAAIVGGRSEDVTQDAFSKALLALRGSEAEIELRPWLYRIVRNTALNDLRDRAPEAAELSEALPGGRGVAAEVEAREELRDLMERLRALPEPQRAALVMRELEGLSHEEIAAALGVSGGAARQAIYRARATLRNGLGLLVPLPLLRALAEHGGEAAVAGGAIAAGAGASTAGGAALGGLGAGAAKVGVATVLVAGTVGAGVALEQRDSGDRGAEAARAVPAAGERQRHGPDPSSRHSGGVAGEPGGGDSSGPGDGSGDDGRDRNEGRRGEDRDREPDDRSGRGRSGNDPQDSDSSGHGGSRSGSGSEESDDGDDDEDRSGSSRSGSSSDSSGSGEVDLDDDSSGSSRGSGSDSSGSGSSDSGGGEVEALEPEPLPAPEPIVESSSGSGGSGEDEGGGSESSGSGSGDSDDD